jgi:hypothetical protein
MRNAFFLLLLVAACGESTETPTVLLPVATASAPLPAATTDLGYDIVVTSLRAAVADLEMTIEGEMHDDVEGAIFHPGHSAGGDVTGELPGDHLLVWDGATHALGEATLTVGDYHGANWTWRAAGEDELDAGDPLIGHTFHVVGVASRDGTDHAFDAVLDLEPGTDLIGAVFELEVTEASTETLDVQMLPTDPEEGDTAFDGVDFAALPVTDDVILIRPGEEAHNILRRPIQTHDHYAITTEN